MGGQLGSCGAAGMATDLDVAKGLVEGVNGSCKVLDSNSGRASPISNVITSGLNRFRLLLRANSFDSSRQSLEVI